MLAVTKAESSTDAQSMPDALAPIAVFAYNRAEHLQHTIRSLLRNRLARDSDLYLFSDAPKSNADAPAVARVRDYVRTIEGFRSVSIIEQTSNLGLAGSIISGVTDLTARFGKVIVVEDDLVVSPFFLDFMNDALSRYADVDSVGAISGYMFGVSANLPETFFLRSTSSWGWATWHRAWKCFDPNGIRLRDQLTAQDLVRHFNYDGQYDFFGMLKNQIAGRNNSWAVRWYASIYLNKLLVLYPGRSLVQNIGHDGSGTHCGPSDAYDVGIATEPVRVTEIALCESVAARTALVDFFQARKPSRAYLVRHAVATLVRATADKLAIGARHPR